MKVIPWNKRQLLLLMRITIFKLFLLFFGAGIAYATPGEAQEILNRTVTLELRNTNLKTALQKIEQATSVRFSYNSNAVNLDQLVNFTSKAEPLKTVLSRMLSPLSISYEVMDEQILLVKSKKKQSAEQPNDNDQLVETYRNPVVEVTGTVTAGGTNEPLAGVSVIEKGTSNGTQTNERGAFRLQVTNANAVLVLTYTGYEQIEVALSGRTALNVSLTAKSNTLNDVVVVGYGSQRRRDITGSVASVKGDQINKVPLTNFDQRLQGQIAGVQVSQTSGSPGGGATIRIRGAGTIGNNQPLFVVDGFPIGNVFNNNLNPLSTINPEDIESIEVLKDASSTAIYGSRGANGVILITTKKGKSGKPKIEFSTSTGFQDLAKKIPLLNGREMADYYVEARNNGWNDRVDLRPAGQTPDQYYATPNANRGAFRIFDYFLDPTQFGKGTDWQDEIFRRAPMSNYQVSVSGGADKVRYLLSGGYFDQKGIVINTGFKRYSFRLNLDAELSSRLKAGVNLAPSFVNADVAVQASRHFGQGNPITASLVMSPTIPVYNPDGSYGHQMGRSDMNLAAVFNPVALAKEATRKRDNMRLLSNVFLDYNILRGLKFRTSFGLDYLTDKGRDFSSSQWGRNSAPPNNPTASAFSNSNVSWLNENTLNFNRQFGEHRLDAVAGYTAQKYSGENINNGRSILPNDLVPYVVGPADQGSSNVNEWSLLSMLARVNYSFSGKYLVTATVRRDGSSRFGANNRWGTFPSAAVGWVLSEEKFMQGQKFFNQIKLRTSYGRTGNFEIGNYEAYSQVAPGQYVGGAGLGNLTNTYALSNIANPDLTWETSYKWDAGIDLSFVNGRFNFTADYYRNRTEDMLLNVEIPSAGGFTTALQNIGKIENTGWEFSLTSENVRTKSFTWNSNLNVAFNRNEVLDLGIFGSKIIANSDGLTGISVTQVGLPIGQFFGRIRQGIFRSDAEAAAYVDKNGNRIQPFAKGGDAKFADVSGDGKIDDDDRTFIGNGLPNYIFGLTNTFTFKGLDLNIVLNGSQGNKIANLSTRFLYNANGNLTQHAQARNRWRSEQDPGDGQTARAILNGRSQAPDAFSTYFVEDGSFVRIRNVSLGYSIPAKMFAKAGISSIRLFASVANLHTFTKYRGYDPEVNERGNEAVTSGIDLGGYPLARTWQFGINVSF